MAAKVRTSADVVGTSRVSNCRLCLLYINSSEIELLQLAPMLHPTSKRIRLNRSSSHSPRVSRKASPLPRRRASELSLSDVDKIVSQNLWYMTVLEEHVAAIRGHPQRPAACERLLKKKGAPHPGHLVGYAEQQKLRVEMEEIIHRRATTVDE